MLFAGICQFLPVTRRLTCAACLYRTYIHPISILYRSYIGKKASFQRICRPIGETKTGPPVNPKTFVSKEIDRSGPPRYFPEEWPYCRKKPGRGQGRSARLQWFRYFWPVLPGPILCSRTKVTRTCGTPSCGRCRAGAGKIFTTKDTRVPPGTDRHIVPRFLREAQDKRLEPIYTRHGHKLRFLSSGKAQFVTAGII